MIKFGIYQLLARTKIYNANSYTLHLVLDHIPINCKLPVIDIQSSCRKSIKLRSSPIVKERIPARVKDNKNIQVKPKSPQEINFTTIIIYLWAVNFWYQKPEMGERILQLRTDVSQTNDISLFYLTQRTVMNLTNTDAWIYHRYLEY
jgi:hypothetical protein